jgi:2-hydroxychromene-2-carboxylate isomerase
MPEASFYFDLGSPFAYLTAERVDSALPGPVIWQPVSLGGLFKANGRSSWALGEADSRQAGMAEVERRTRDYGLKPVRWPDPWPTNYLYAMRAATYAFRVGRGREFTIEAFRHAFARGQDLAIVENVLRAAERAGLDPRAVDEATGDPEIKLALRAATDAAHALGVFGVPTIAVDGELFWGDDRLSDAAAALTVAMLEQKFAADLQRLEAAMTSSGAATDQAHAAGEFLHYVYRDPEWPRLYQEFAAHAARNEDFRAQFAARQRELCAGMADVFTRWASSLGVKPHLDAEDVAAMTFFMADGFLLSRIIDPELGEGLYAEMVEVFTRGLLAMAQVRPPAI